MKNVNCIYSERMWCTHPELKRGIFENRRRLCFLYASPKPKCGYCSTSYTCLLQIEHPKPKFPPPPPSKQKNKSMQIENCDDWIVACEEDKIINGAVIYDDIGVGYVKINKTSRIDGSQPADYEVFRLKDGMIIHPSLMIFPVGVNRPEEF